jgi:hypothetical protein
MLGGLQAIHQASILECAYSEQQQVHEMKCSTTGAEEVSRSDLA